MVAVAAKGGRSDEGSLRASHPLAKVSSSPFSRCSASVKADSCINNNLILVTMSGFWHCWHLYKLLRTVILTVVQQCLASTLIRYYCTHYEPSFYLSFSLWRQSINVIVVFTKVSHICSDITVLLFELMPRIFHCSCIHMDIVILSSFINLPP